VEIFRFGVPAVLATIGDGYGLAFLIAHVRIGTATAGRRP